MREFLREMELKNTKFAKVDNGQKTMTHSPKKPHDMSYALQLQYSLGTTCRGVFSKGNSNGYRFWFPGIDRRTDAIFGQNISRVYFLSISNGFIDVGRFFLDPGWLAFLFFVLTLFFVTRLTDWFPDSTVFRVFWLATIISRFPFPVREIWPTSRSVNGKRGLRFFENP